MSMMKCFGRQEWNSFILSSVAFGVQRGSMGRETHLPLLSVAVQSNSVLQEEIDFRWKRNQIEDLKMDILSDTFK